MRGKKKDILTDWKSGYSAKNSWREELVEESSSTQLSSISLLIFNGIIDFSFSMDFSPSSYLCCFLNWFYWHLQFCICVVCRIGREERKALPITIDGHFLWFHQCILNNFLNRKNFFYANLSNFLKTRWSCARV